MNTSDRYKENLANAGLEYSEKVINDLLKNDYKISLSPDTTYRELNKAAQRSITAPDRIGERKT